MNPKQNYALIGNMWICTGVISNNKIPLVAGMLMIGIILILEFIDKK